MPYGIPKEKGGESRRNLEKMESCVRQVLAKNPNLPKWKAIRNCKAYLGLTKD